MLYFRKLRRLLTIGVQKLKAAVSQRYIDGTILSILQIRSRNRTIYVTDHAHLSRDVAVGQKSMNRFLKAQSLLSKFCASLMKHTNAIVEEIQSDCSKLEKTCGQCSEDVRWRGGKVC